MQAKDNVYDPYWEFADLEEERKELNRVAEVRRARSRDQEARGSEKVENPETTGEKIQTLGDSGESGTEGGTHDIRRRTYRKKGKLQQDGKKKKKE